MSELKKETLEAVEDGIALQMERLVDDNYENAPAQWGQIAKGASDLMDKYIAYKQQTDMAIASSEKNAIEQAKLELEKRKAAIEEERNKIDSDKIKIQQQLDQAKIDLERSKTELEKTRLDIDKEIRTLTLKAEEIKANATLLSAQAAIERNGVEAKAAELRYESDTATTKAENGWKRVLIEGIKIAIPAGVSVLTLAIWKEEIDKTLIFEETGKICTSTMGKFLKFPHLTGF